MKPLKDWDSAKRGYRFGDATFYNSKHLGVDHIVGSGTELYAPFNGVIIWEGYGSQGGNTIHFRPDGQDVVIRFMHLKEFKRGQEHVNEGDVIAITGNTGSATTGAHLHTDVSRGSVQISNFNNFINPEEFNWGKDSMDLREIAEGLSAARTFNPEEPEVNYITAYLNNGGKPKDYARNNLFMDAVVNNLWIATEGVHAPAGEKSFWRQYGVEHPNENIPEKLAFQWFGDHVKPLKDQIANLNAEIKRLNALPPKVIETIVKVPEFIEVNKLTDEERKKAVEEYFIANPPVTQTTKISVYDVIKLLFKAIADSLKTKEIEIKDETKKG